MPQASGRKAVVLWAVSALLALLFLFAGGTKLAGQQMHIEHFAKWGYPDWFRLVVGATEVIAGLLLLVPSLAAYAAAVLGLEMVGAIVTHLTHDEAPNALVPFVLALMLLAVVYGRKSSAAVP